MKSVIRSFTVLAFTFLVLCGCYESETLLLDASAAQQPITVSDDWTFTRDEVTRHARLNPRTDGWYDYEDTIVNEDGTDFEEGWVQYKVLLNDLMEFNGQSIYVSAHWDDGEQAYVYSIVAFDVNGAWQSITPGCDGDPQDLFGSIDIAAARDVGVEFVDTGFATVCMFSTKDQLFTAMKTIVNGANFQMRIDQAKQ